jgi:2-methylcitrate dehydratase PrpD
MPVQRSTFSLRTEEVVIIGLNFSAKRCVSSARYDGMRAVYAASLEQKFAQSIPVDWEDPSLDVVKQTIMKKYCARIHGQPVLEAVLDLKRRSSFTADEIEHVGCDVFKPAFDFAGGRELGPKDHPEIKERGDYNLKYLVAAALLDDQVGPAHLEELRIQAPDAQALLARVEVIPTSVSALVILENSVPLLRFAAKTSVSL